MKKILLIPILLAFAVTVKGQFEIRPVFGVNWSNVVKSPDGTSTQANIGTQFGGYIMVGNRLHFYPGIVYHQQNTEYTFNSGQNEESRTEKIAGVKIPLLIGYRFVEPTNKPFFNLRVFAGPSILFHTKNTFSDNVIDDEIDWNSVSWAGRIGAGLDVSFVFVDVGYEFGLSNDNKDTGTLDNFTDIKHNTFLVNVGVRLKL